MSKTLRLDQSIDDRDLGAFNTRTVRRRTWHSLWLRKRPVEVTAMTDTERLIEVKR